MGLNKQEINDFIITLMYAYHDELMRIAAIRIKNKSDIEDVISEMWMEAVKDVDYLYEHPNQKAWLVYKLNLIIKRYRSKGTLRSRKTDSSGKIHKSKRYVAEYPTSEFLESSFNYKENFYEGESFDEFKGILSKRELEYLNYAYRDDLDMATIAEKMGMSYSNITTLGSRVRKKIKKYLEKV